jgi:hypothetical protein
MLSGSVVQMWWAGANILKKKVASSRGVVFQLGVGVGLTNPHSNNHIFTNGIRGLGLEIIVLNGLRDGK